MNPLLDLLYEAINTPLGIIVSTTDPVLLRQKLYPLRKSDPDFEPLTFLPSPKQPDIHLWIVRKPEKIVAET